MERVTNRCQNCKSEFTVEPEDFTFYEKIKVPAPTWCPECRLQRRLLFRNERTLYKRVCNLCGRNIISMYSASVPFPVYCSPCWWSDKWDPLVFGKEYNFSKPFFKQLKELQNKTPRESLQGKQSVGSEYANYTVNSKNIYLSLIIVESEDVIYSRFIFQSTNCVDCSYITKCNNCLRISRAAFCGDCSDGTILENCRDVHFTYDSQNCSYCYGCINLRHKKYHIFNKPYSKEEYEKTVAELMSLPLEIQQQKVEEFFLTQPHRGYVHFDSVNVSGDDIYYSKNCQHCITANFVEDSAYLFQTSSLSRSGSYIRDNYDCSIIADMELGYETIGGSKSYQSHFGIINDDCLSADYSIFCYNSSYLLGCVGLRHKKYCVLNKQYSKESFDELRIKIIESMNEVPYVDKKGRVYKYGEFFPVELSPFAYNETLAQEYFPIDREKSQKMGFIWKEPEDKSYNITITADSLPANIKEVSDPILNEVVGCEHQNRCNEQCTTAFKIISKELEIYRKLNMPLPKLCPNCRHYQRLKQWNPLKLWHRKCDCAGETSNNKIYPNQGKHFHGNEPCPNEFETSYAPERPEIVYCEQCYQEEVV